MSLFNSPGTLVAQACAAGWTRHPARILTCASLNPSHLVSRVCLPQLTPPPPGPGESRPHSTSSPAIPATGAAGGGEEERAEGEPARSCCKASSQSQSLHAETVGQAVSECFLPGRFRSLREQKRGNAAPWRVLQGSTGPATVERAHPTPTPGFGQRFLLAETLRLWAGEELPALSSLPRELSGAVGT